MTVSLLAAYETNRPLDGGHFLRNFNSKRVKNFKNDTSFKLTITKTSNDLSNGVRLTQYHSVMIIQYHMQTAVCQTQRHKFASADTAHNSRELHRNKGHQQISLL
jgi:hypothetical protein